MQGDFYTVGKYREKGLQPFDMQKAIDENADLRAVQRRRGRARRATTRSRRRSARSVRLFVGNGGPNLVSSFHVIGEIFDRVCTRAARASRRTCRRRWFPRAARRSSSSTSRCRARYVLVDHSHLPRVQQGRARRCSRSTAREPRRSTRARRSTRCTSPTRRVAGPAAVAAAAARRGGHADDGASRCRQARCSSRAPARPATRRNGQGIAGRVPAAREVGLPRWRTRSASIDIVLQRPDRDGQGQRPGLRLRDAADEPAHRRRDRQHPDVRAQRWGNRGDAVTAAEVAAVRASDDAAAGRRPMMPTRGALAMLRARGRRWTALSEAERKARHPPDPRRRSVASRRSGSTAPVANARVPRLRRASSPRGNGTGFRGVRRARLPRAWRAADARRRPPSRSRGDVVRGPGLLRAPGEATADRGRVGVRGRGERHEADAGDPACVRRCSPGTRADRRRRLHAVGGEAERLGRAGPARRSSGSGSTTSTPCSRPATRAGRRTGRGRSAALARVGAADAATTPASCASRSAARSGARYTTGNLGFRCARDEVTP